MIEPNFAGICEAAYRAYHQPQFISPDPIEIVLTYERAEDRETVGFLATALALGRVGGILASVRGVIERIRTLGPTPHRALRDATENELQEVCEGFVYRFFDERQLLGLLTAIGRCYREFGSLESLFQRTTGEWDPTEPARRTVQGLDGMVRYLRWAADGALDRSILLSLPEKGSACKRLLLFLRWMVRQDEIDPGGWTAIRPRELLVPVDTHMLSLARFLKLTDSRQASLRASYEITEAFRQIVPDDPVRFDFSLTRLGIHPDLDKQAFMDKYDFTSAPNFATF